FPYIRLPRPTSPPFPYTTLFRSRRCARGRVFSARRARGRPPVGRSRRADTRGPASGPKRSPRSSDTLRSEVVFRRGRWKLELGRDRKSTRLNSSHVAISYAVFCL